MMQNGNALAKTGSGFLVSATLFVVALLIASPLSATDAGKIAASKSTVDQPKPVKSIVLTSPASKLIRKFPGHLKALHEVMLSFRVSGPLVELPATKGQEVRKGDLLAKLDPRDYESSLASIAAQVEKAKEDLRAMEQARPEEISRLQSAVNAAKATHENNRVNLERAKNLFEQKVIPKVDLDQASATFDVSKSSLEEAEEALKIGQRGAREEDVAAAKANIQSLEAQMKAAKDSLSDVELRAPFDGIVSDRYVENHQMVTEKQDILSMQDLNTFEVIVNIPEQLVLLLPRGKIEGKAKASAWFDSIPGKSFPLSFKEFSTRADIQAQTFAATFIMSAERDKYHFLPGMTVTVELEVNRDDIKEAGAFVLPIEAIVAGNDQKSYVWHLVDGGKPGVYKAEKTEVKVDQLIDSGVLVTEGVKTGERYATTGATFLQEGMLVTDLAWEEGAN